jgi:hypothetical protein
MKTSLLIIIVSLITISSYALYYGIPIAIDGDNIQGIEINSGDTPFPTNSIFPVPSELKSLPAKYLKVVDGKIVSRTNDEKLFTDLPIKYKKLVNGIWIEISSSEKAFIDLPSKYKKLVNGSLLEMTADEKLTVDLATESARQHQKSPALKKAENSYLTMCDTLSATNTHAKLGFDALKAMITTLPMEQQILLSIQLLVLDAELKREGGNNWWDDCSWHPELN